MERPPVEEHLRAIKVFEKQRWPCVFGGNEVQELCEYIQQMGSGAGIDLLGRSKILDLLLEHIDYQGDLPFSDDCPGWCQCWDGNPCSFQLEYHARRKTYGQESADKWAAQVNGVKIPEQDQSDES